MTKIKKKYAETPEGGKEQPAEEESPKTEKRKKRSKPKKHKFIIPEDEKVKEPMTNEQKLYYIKLLVAFSAALILSLLGVVGWWLLLALVSSWFGLPLLIGYLMAPYDKEKWDWKMFEKTAVGAFFFIFMVVATLIHTLIVTGSPSFVPPW